MRGAVVGASRGVSLHKVVQQACLPFQFVSSGSRTLTLMSRREVEARFTIRWTCPQSTHCCSQHCRFAFQRKKGWSEAPASFCDLLGSTIPPGSHTGPSLIAGASCECQRARLFAKTIGANNGRGKSSFRSSLSAHSFQSAKVAVNPRLRFDIHGTRLIQVDLGSACSDEGLVMRPRPSQLSQAHDDGACGATYPAPQGFHGHQPLLPPPDRFCPNNDGLNPAGVDRVTLVRGQAQM